MPIFVFEAAEESGKIVRGEIEGIDRKEAIGLLQKKKLLPINLEEHGDGHSLKRRGIVFFERIRPVDKIILVRNLAVTLRA